jgi:hypothetical protein
MLTKKAPATIATSLTIKGQGETCKFDVTYFNRTQAEIDEQVAKGITNGELVLFVVKDWDTEYELSTAGLAEMESTRPGIVAAVFQGYNDARVVQREKN